MRDLLVYDFTEVRNNGTSDNYAVFFLTGIKVEFDFLEDAIRTHLSKGNLYTRIYVVGGEYLRYSLESIFVNDIDRIYQNIRGIKTLFDHDVFSVNVFDGNGSWRNIRGGTVDSSMVKRINREGLTQVFVNNHGAITAQPGHHFVFPSGKHCEKFLRTGNVLVKSEIIFFIAYNMLSYFDSNKYKVICCDTSSINSLAFALIELKSRFFEPHKFDKPYIQSFGSYRSFENDGFSALEETLFLISSSTSGNIIKRLVSKHSVKPHNILIIYYLRSESQGSSDSKVKRLVCDLEIASDNPNGLYPFKTYQIKSSADSSKQCIHCNNGSIPIEVNGDVLLMEKPSIDEIKIVATDAPDYISDFVADCLSANKKGRHLIRCNHQASNSYNIKYEVFFDLVDYFKDFKTKETDLKGHSLPKFRNKIIKYIHQYVPAHTRYIIHANDEASRLLANIVKEVISHGQRSIAKKIVIVDKLSIEKQIPNNARGVVVTVCSCMVSGGELLSISRSLRKKEKLSKIYFVALSRTTNKSKLKFIKNNLSFGKYGGETNPFITVEQISCSNSLEYTPWIRESLLLTKLNQFCTKRSDIYDIQLSEELINRIELIEEAGRSRGLVNNAFVTNPITNNEFKINPSFAFFKFDNYYSSISHADIYFVVSSILNRLRNGEVANKTIYNSYYHRTVLDPENFSRFNDGILQAALLRATNYTELGYDVDTGISYKMATFLKSIIDNCGSDDADALYEFLLAIADKKLRLSSANLVEVVQKIRENKVLYANSFKLLTDFIEHTVINNKEYDEL